MHVSSDPNPKIKRPRVTYYGPIDYTYTERLERELQRKGQDVDRAKLTRAKQVQQY